ncbi:WGR domain-containing protein [Kitasatospora sp. NPDC004531]
MRRWELVGDGSAKFWEAATDGATVRIRQGRIGTAGRAQAKELADPAAAEAHLAQQIAKKERKGYREAAATDAPTAPPSEAARPTDDTDDPHDVEFAELPHEDGPFTLPASWYPLVVPRRGGGVPVGPARPVMDPAVAEDLDGLRIAKNEAWIDQVLQERASERYLVRAARAHLRGMPDAIGAAALAAMQRETWQKGGFQEVFDCWIARFGLGFAARATVAAFEFDAGCARPNHHRAGLVSEGAGRRDLRGTEFAFALAREVRQALALADEDEYRSVLAELAAIRTRRDRRAATVFLAPEVPGWMDECLDELPAHRRISEVSYALLLHSVGTADQLARLERQSALSWFDWSSGQLATLADALGAASVSLLGRALDTQYDTDRLRELALQTAEFPSDEAFRVLLDRISIRHVRPGLLRAMHRYPVRAVRLLAEAARQWVGAEAASARQLLVRQLGVLRPHLPEVLAQLDADTAEFVAALAEGAPQRVPEAAASALPELLASPPWTRPRPTRRPKALTGIVADDPARLVWQEGEREQWLAHREGPWDFGPSFDWAAEAAKYLTEAGGVWYGAELLRHGPAEIVGPYLAEWRPGDYWDSAESLRPVVARFGLAALPLLHVGAAAQPAHVVPLLLPFRDATVAAVMADALVRLKSQRATARSWFARHGVAGALLLVPKAVGRAGKARQAAENALRLVAAQRGAEVLLAAVRERFGDPVAAVVAEALDADLLVTTLPARMPEFPEWLLLGGLPQLVLRSDAALPRSAVRQVVTMMTLSKLRDPYPGLPLVADVLRPESAAAFVWAVFEEWRQAGMPSSDSWALFVLGEWGDDGTARRLAPVLREWPGQGSHHRAVEGLEVLAAIGSDVALMQLNSIAQRVKFKALKTRAREKITEIAESRGLTAEQLADRLVPDLGLAADGTTVVDYGARTFTVGFDEQLRPYVLGADGKRRKDLPAPAAMDTPELVL